MIYSGQRKKNGLTEKLKHLWRMKETEKQIRFERVSEVVFNSYNEVYEFSFTCG